ncbi:MAG: GNAT family N-acetyltransferase [Verrucomicrobia bacterium]|nr:GNAT family N-acetyltransferase [Verrucomicrobiota bacterium]
MKVLSMVDTIPASSANLRLSQRESLIKGQPAKIRCVEIDAQNYVLERGPVTVLSLEDEWYEDVRDPEFVLESLRSNRGFKPDIFSFWQRVPDTNKRYSYHTEWEDIAVLPIQSYEFWWNQQIKSRIRNLVRKTEKEGVVVKEAVYDDEFVRGMTDIFNEAPIRQGRQFWHYGKTSEEVKTQFSRYLHREQMIGAYHEGELIGFVMLGNAQRYGLTGQIISSLKHRDKAITNALVAKTVQVCERLKLPYLVYFFWTDDSLAEFKRRCGFEKMSIPRYFVPLTTKGRLALRLGLHRGWKAAIPPQLKNRLKEYRRSWNESKSVVEKEA